MKEQIMRPLLALRGTKLSIEDLENLVRFGMEFNIYEDKNSENNILK
jgi:hypothetical protein